MDVVKRINSAVLILLILLNVLGYYGVFMGLDYQNSRAMLHKLDSGSYNEQDEVTIKIPVAVPYLPDAEGFERVDGRFEHKGEVYRMVKQRYSQDTLYIVCVKDHTGTRLQRALTSYVKTFSDKPADSKQRGKVASGFNNEYFLRYIQLERRAVGWHYAVITTGSALASFIPSFSFSIIHPPE